MNRRFGESSRTSSRYPSWRQVPVTYSLIVITVFWYFVVESLYGHSVTGLMHAGALAGVSIQTGQWYRLVSAIFVHLSVIHLLLNMVSLWSLFVVELIFGMKPFLVLYVLSGIIGNMISAILMDPFVLSAGASGAVFGVFGAIFALSFQGGLNKVLRNQLILLLAANLIFDLANPDINLVAHLGGLFVGIVFTWIYKRTKSKQKLWTILAYSTGIVLVLGLVSTKFWV